NAVGTKTHVHGTDHLAFPIRQVSHTQNNWHGNDQNFDGSPDHQPGRRPDKLRAKVLNCCKPLHQARSTVKRPKLLPKAALASNAAAMRTQPEATVSSICAGSVTCPCSDRTITASPSSTPRPASVAEAMRALGGREAAVSCKGADRRT